MNMYTEITPGVEVRDLVGVLTALLVIFVVCHFACTPLRQQRLRRWIIQALITAAVFAGWYFIPTLFSRGVYEKIEPARMREDCYEGTISVDRFLTVRGNPYDYRYDFKNRLLWIDGSEFDDDNDEEALIPLKIRWNRIYVRFFSNWLPFQLRHNPVQNFFEFSTTVFIAVMIGYNLRDRKNKNSEPEH